MTPNKSTRIALGVEYHGTAYHGWQRQISHAGEALDTVQLRLEQALSAVADQPVRVVCAGRTDVGVHAIEQVVHFDAAVERPDSAWILGTNSNLPLDIRVRWMKVVAEDFHARYSAKSRQYQYVIDNRPVASALWRHHVTWVRRPLDVEKMHDAAQCLIGEHDFSAFRGAGCQSHSPMRSVTHLQIERHEHRVVVDIRANAFLYHMVRNIMGVLMPVGIGEQPPGWVAEVLASRDRNAGGVTAPAGGLYLVGVEYEW